MTSVTVKDIPDYIDDKIRIMQAESRLSKSDQIIDILKIFFKEKNNNSRVNNGE